MLNAVQTAAKRPRAAALQSPFGEFAVLGALLVGLQYGVTTLQAPSYPSPADSLALANTAAKYHPAAALSDTAIVSMTSANLTISSDSVSVSDVPVPSNVLKASSITSDAQVGELVSDSMIDKDRLQQAPEANVTAVNFTDFPRAEAKYQFIYNGEHALFEAVNENPFSVSADAANNLAVWQTNAEFAFIEKPERFVIVIDPGHGGSDPGSIGHNGLEEKALTLDIAKRAQRLLRWQKNIHVVLTRDTDEGMSRYSRVEKVKKSDADMFVSLHLNHLPQTDVNLVETFYAAPDNIRESMEMQRAQANASGMVKTNTQHNHDFAFTHGSKQLASIMQKSVYDQVSAADPKTDNAGVKQDTLFILTRSFTPGALIELSCLSNIKEAERLNDPVYRQKLARALATGIREYVKTPAAKHQFGPEV